MFDCGAGGDADGGGEGAEEDVVDDADGGEELEAVEAEGRVGGGG